MIFTDLKESDRKDLIEYISWHMDYENILLNMVMGETESFDIIIKKLEELNESINQE